MTIPECLDKIYSYLTTTPNKIEDDEPEFELESLEDDEYAGEDGHYDDEDFDEDYDYDYDFSIESALVEISVETSEDEYLKQVLIAENTYLKAVIDLQTYRLEKRDRAYEELGYILMQTINIDQDLNEQLNKSSTSVEELSQEENPV